MIKVKNLKNILLLSASIFSFNLYSYDNFKNYNLDKAEKTIYFGGWSKHSRNENFEREYKLATGEDFKYNENHNGLGFQYSLPNKNDNSFISIDFFYMKDSFYNDSYQFSLGYKYRYEVNKLIESIDFGIGFSIFSRSILDIESEISSRYNIKNNKLVFKENGDPSYIYSNQNTINYNRGLVAAPLPYITFNLNKNISLDLILTYYTMDFSYSGEKVDSYEFERENSWESLIFIRLGYKY